MEDKPSLEIILTELDIKQLDEHDVSSELRKHHKDFLDEQNYKYENIAFNLDDDYLNKENGWGHYYGPKMVWKDENGNWLEAPSIKDIEEQTIYYWTERALKAKVPQMILRYADLVWEFSLKITNQRPDIKLAQLIIDSTISIIDLKLYKYETDAITKLKRALAVATSINDSDRIKKVVETIVNFEDEIAVDDSPGLWGFSYDSLVGVKKKVINEKQEEKIIKDLEKRLTRISGKNPNFSLIGIEVATERLYKYYKTRDITKAKEFMKICGQAYVLVGDAGGGALVSSHWLQKAYEHFLKYGFKSEAEAASIKLQKISPTILNELKETTVEITIPQKEFDEFMTSILADTIEQALFNICIHLLPDNEKLKERTFKMAKEHPILSIFSRSMITEDGRTSAKIGSIEEDLEGRITQEMNNDFKLDPIFLHSIMEKAKDKYNFGSLNIIDFIYNSKYKSSIFAEDRKELISKGIQLYLDKDYIMAAHILIPQIENALRVLLKMNGGDIYKPAKNGGLFLKNLDEILRSELITDILTERITKYLHVVFTDPRGLNIRNEVCHGLISPNRISPYICDRIFHSLILLSLVTE